MRAGPLTEHPASPAGEPSRLGPFRARGLAGRLMKVIFGGYLLVALLLTAAQMTLEYRSAHGKLEEDVAALRNTFGPGIADAVWRFNTEVLTGILSGMMELPIVRGVEVRNETGQRLEASGETGEEASPPGQAEAASGWRAWLPVLGRFHRDFDLVYVDERGTSHVIGSWTVFANHDDVFRQLMRTLSIVLVNSAIKTLMLWAIFYWVIRRMVGRPLAAMSAFVREIDADNLGARPPVLELEGRYELQALAETLDTMAARLKRSFEDNDALLASTRDLNATLQAKVAERTRELEILAETDLLTGLANRRKLDEVLGREVERAGRTGKPLSIVLGDIDHFKLVNDRHGHKAGDAVLAAFAQALGKTVRPGDTLGRWGGEEFFLVCPGTALEEAVALAESMRRQIEETPLPVVGRRSCSFGVAALRAGESEDEIVIRADAALYEAKGGGRNRVVASPS